MNSMTVGGNQLAVRTLTGGSLEVQVCEIVGITGTDGAYIANPLATAAGAPAGLLFTVQGDPAGEPIPVDIGSPTISLTLGTFAAPLRTDPTGTTAQPVTGPVTDAQIRATPLPVSGPATDAQLRATPLPVSGFPATQAISAVSLPLPTGAASELTLAGLNAKFIADTYADFDTTPATSNVRVIGLVLPSAAGPVIAGTAANPIRTDPTGNTPQPVTGPVTDAQMRATPLPVSGPATNAELRATPLPVSGFPATQPISAAALPLPAGAATETTLAAVNGKLVSAVVVDYDTNPATVNVEMRGLALPGAGGPVAGGTSANPIRTDPTGTTAQPVSQGVAGAAANAWGVRLSDGSSFASLAAINVDAINAGTNIAQVCTGSIWLFNGATYDRARGDVANGLDVDVTRMPALTKGTQGATGVSTQDLKDAGRNVTNYFMALPVLTTAADVLMSLTGFKGGAAVAANTQPAVVSAGKTYRINKITITYIATATAGEVRVSLRVNTGGAVLVTSPVVESWVVGAGTPATAGSSQTVTISFPDGLEFAAGAGIGITIAGVSAAGALAIAGYGQVSLSGFEY
jgi:hypothetical protein